jgi:AcrR family transcriptional regulator
VEAILDAAAALIGEQGLPAATMQAIAARSGTTFGSLYHFFPDRDAVLLALHARHGREIAAHAASALIEDWARLTLESAVELYLETLIGYVQTRPDTLLVLRAVESLHPEAARAPAAERMLTELTGRLVAVAHPDASPAARATTTAMVRALVLGTVAEAALPGRPGAGSMGRCQPLPPATFRRELARALTAYLRAA